MYVVETEVNTSRINVSRNLGDKQS